MPDSIKKTVKIVTEQKINPSKPPAEGGLPIRNWNIEVYMLNDKKEDVAATIFEKVTYDLHPSFGKRAKQVKKDPPFRIAEEGWGEFEMMLHFAPVGKGDSISVPHDLNFAETRYEVTHELTFKNPKAELLRAIEDNGENGVKRGVAGGKRKGKGSNIDMEKLAEGLQKLGEEDLLHVVQMIHDQKTSDTYAVNDVDAGEFKVDLFTLPDACVKSLWEFTAAKVEL